MKNIATTVLLVFASVFATMGCISSSDSDGQTETQQAPQELKTHTQGVPNAKVEIVLYEDLACPFTHALQPRIAQLMQAHPMDVKLTFRHFPLDFEADAMPAAEAVECASELGGEGAFWDMHDRILATAPTFTNDTRIDFAHIAKEIGIDGASFAICLQSGKYKALIESARDTASSQGINGSPTMTFNGTLVSGAVDYGKLEAAYTAASQAR